MTEITITITITQNDSTLSASASPTLAVLGPGDSLVLDVDASAVQQEAAFGAESGGGFNWQAGKAAQYSTGPGNTVSYGSQEIGSWTEGLNKMTVGKLTAAAIYRLVPTVLLGNSGLYSAGPSIPAIDVFLCPEVPDVVSSIELADDLSFSYTQLFPQTSLTGIVAGYGQGTATFTVDLNKKLNVMFWLRSTVRQAIFASGTKLSPTWWYASQEDTNQSADPPSDSIQITRWGDYLFQLEDTNDQAKQAISRYFRTVLELQESRTLIVSKDPTVVNKATSGQG